MALGVSPFKIKPGVARRLLTFLLLRQKQSKQKKRRPAVWVPSLRYGHLAVLEPVGVTCKLAALKQARALIRPLLRSSAQPGRVWEEIRTLVVVAALSLNP
jgi:hypothetical protein